jgi:hypothetical protein
VGGGDGKFVPSGHAAQPLEGFDPRFEITLKIWKGQAKRAVAVYDGVDAQGDSSWLVPSLEEKPEVPLEDV